jgi:hypothetical protein
MKKDNIISLIEKIGLGDKPIFKALHYHSKRTTGLIHGIHSTIDTNIVGRWSAKARGGKNRTIQVWGFTPQEALQNLLKEI